MGRPTADPIADLLAVASSNVVPTPGREPWTQGWYVREYRHSDEAALPGPKGPVTLSSDGLVSLENAAEMLLREKAVLDRWDPEEFWGVLASLVVAASDRRDSKAFLKSKVKLLRTIGRSLTIDLIANVTWGRAPVDFGDTIIGDADAAFLEFVNSHARRRLKVSAEVASTWLDTHVQGRINEEDGTRPVAIAAWTVGQQMLADRETERELRNVVDLALLLERELKAHKVYRRGDTNRPGLRGPTLDRGAVEQGLSGIPVFELASVPLHVDALDGEQWHFQWFNAEPFPLGQLLNQEYLHEAVTSCLKQNPISNRIRVAARWFAEAHYSIADDDAALALGVAMDAMLTGQRALPGGAMADRFALLAEDPSDRRERAKTYLDFYSVRSSVAHGGRSSKLDQGDFMETYLEFVRWAAWRLLAVQDTFAPSSEKEIDILFDDLRWGIRTWP